MEQFAIPFILDKIFYVLCINLPFKVIDQFSLPLLNIFG